MRTKKIVPYVSHGSLIIGGAIGLYAFADIYLIKSKLTPGMCPVTNNRPLFYIAIALCFISLVLSFFEPKAKKERESN